MNNSDSQIIYYCKGWFEQKPNIVDDLRILVGNWTLTDPKFITISDVASVIGNIAWKYKSQQQDSKSLHLEIVNDLIPKNRWTFGSNEEDDYLVALIKKYVSIIRRLKIKDKDNVLIEMDKPDYSLLPKRKD